MLDKLGGLAQLVERLLCKQDVSGSSPLTSIGLTPIGHQTRIDKVLQTSEVISAPTNKE